MTPVEPQVMSAPSLLLIPVALGVFGALFAWFLRLERSDRSLTVVLVVFGVLVLDSVLFWNQDDAPAGIFHPTIAGVNFRLEDVIVPIALGARLIVRGVPQRIGFAALVWISFLVWLASAFVQGMLSGNSFTLITFEGKALIYLGAMVLTAGVPAEKYVEAVRRVAPYLSVLAALTIAAGASNVAITGTVVPGITLQEFGKLGADTATILAGIAIVLVAVAACSRRRRFAMLMAAAPLMATTLIAEQRAALLGLAVSLLVVGVLLPFGSRHVRATPTELWLMLLLVAACFVLPPGTKAALGSAKPTLPFAAQLQTAFASRGKQLSAEDRVNQYHKATKLIAERPVFGWGLGKTYTYYEPGFYQFYETNLTHNIVLDLLLRTGVIGVCLFLLAIVITLISGANVWLRHPEAEVAALALGATANVAGMLSKGLVESIFEKYRLALFLGLMIGIIASSARSLRATTQEPDRAQLQPARA